MFKMFSAGLDLGQRSDPSALVVVERRDLWQGFGAQTFDSIAVRFVEKMALGTPYPMVAERAKAVVQSPVLLGGCSLTVDATGVGAPVVEMLRASRMGDLCAVTITGGEKASQHSLGWNVPKQDLVGGLQLLLEQGRLRIAKDMKGLRTLMRELMDMQAKMGASGRVRTGADGYGQHDDLVMALALACWRARKQKGIEGPGRLPLIG